MAQSVIGERPRAGVEGESWACYPVSSWFSILLDLGLPPTPLTPLPDEHTERGKKNGGGCCHLHSRSGVPATLHSHQGLYKCPVPGGCSRPPLRGTHEAHSPGIQAVGSPCCHQARGRQEKGGPPTKAGPALPHLISGLPAAEGCGATP